MQAATPQLMLAWLTARSVARGLPAPVPDRGGYRVDTASEAEARRWVFAEVSDGLVEIARTVRAPRTFLKLCGPSDALRAALPDHWRIEPSSHFMIAGAPAAPPPLPPGYRLETERAGAVISARILAIGGAPAAGGFAAEAAGAFVYDRIVTEPDHRRKGLGRVVMNALKAMKTESSLPELLVATDEGRALYATLDWRTLSPWATASTIAA